MTSRERIGTELIGTKGFRRLTTPLFLLDEHMNIFNTFHQLLYYIQNTVNLKLYSFYNSYFESKVKHMVIHKSSESN